MVRGVGAVCVSLLRVTLTPYPVGRSTTHTRAARRRSGAAVAADVAKQQLLAPVTPLLPSFQLPHLRHKARGRLILEGPQHLKLVIQDALCPSERGGVSGIPSRA